MSFIFTQCPKFLHNVLHYDASLAHCFALQFDIIMMVYLNILLVLYFKNSLKVAKYFATLWHIWQTDIAFCKNCVLFHVTSAWLELDIALHPSVWQRGRLSIIFVQQWQCGIAALIWTSQSMTRGQKTGPKEELSGTGLLWYHSLVLVLSDIIKEYGIPVEQYHGTGGRPISYHGGSCDYRSSKRSQPV